MTLFERIAAFFQSLFGSGGSDVSQPANVASAADVAATQEIYGMRPTPGPLTGDAPVNFPATLTYWTWNLYGPDVSGSPNYPASVTNEPSQGGNWRDRVRVFLESLGNTPTPPITPPVSVDNFGATVAVDGKDFWTWNDPVKPPPPTSTATPANPKDVGTYTDPGRPWQSTPTGDAWTYTPPTGNPPPDDYVFGRPRWKVGAGETPSNTVITGIGNSASGAQPNARAGQVAWDIAYNKSV